MDTSNAPQAIGEGLPVSPTLEFVLQNADMPSHTVLVDSRVLLVTMVAMGTGVLSAIVAQLLMGLIGFFTNLSFYGRFSTAMVSPANNSLGVFVIFVPVLGAVVIGVIARYGSKAIRGHGIPEAMEQVLTNRSRIPARITILKPLSAAISIGTGGPFGAEGPIIATGGALGSVIGQMLSTTAAERKTLLAAGAAAGMAATFGSPVSAVLLAIELLLFEFRPRSIIPVAMASATAAGVRWMFEGTEPVFPMPNLTAPSFPSLLVYMVIGACTGFAAILVTRIVYGIEDAFEKLPIHWMWWPSIGAVAVGIVGYFAPLTLGVGYDNITNIISNHLTVGAIAFLCVMKFISWSISLGSGTSGGTLAPLFTIGGGLGALLGSAVASAFPFLGVDVRIAGLVGMAAMFAGASRAMLASAVFAFETTQQPLGLLPLLAGCSAAFLVSCLRMRHSIMTEKIARRGIHTPAEYVADVLDQVRVRDIASRAVVTLKADEPIWVARQFIESPAPGAKHQGFPVVDSRGIPLGVVTRRSLLEPASADGRRVRDLLVGPLRFIYADCTVRQAVDQMVRHEIGRLPVLSRDEAGRLVGMVTRSDILSAYRVSLQESCRENPTIPWRKWPFVSKTELPEETAN
ncbi:MAG: chloride channel protein [Planctomycetota bacterium]